MTHSLDALSPRAALVEIAHDFHTRGWMHGTAGNLSARADEAHFWITASGKPKGRLEEGDFLLIRIADGQVADNARRICAGILAADPDNADGDMNTVDYILQTAIWGEQVFG